MNQRKFAKMGVKTKVATVSSVGAGTALTIAPAVASTVGFTTSGIAAGSSAATMMSVLGGATTQAGGIVATLQAVGATSSIFVSAPAVIAVGGTGIVVAGVGYGAYKGVKHLYRKYRKRV